MANARREFHELGVNHPSKAAEQALKFFPGHGPAALGANRWARV